MAEARNGATAHWSRRFDVPRRNPHYLTFPKEAPPLHPGSLGANSLRIEVNGEARDTAATTILGLVQELSLDPKKVAVERNLEIVPRSLHGETALAEGDKIELVQFVGGG